MDSRSSQRWRLLFLSAGETSLSDVMARAGKQSTAGQEIRLADIEADAGAAMGIFETLHGLPNAAAPGASNQGSIRQVSRRCGNNGCATW